MKNIKCLFCYELLKSDESDVHSSCNQKFFKQKIPLSVDLSLNEIEELASKTVNQRLTVTGVQRKMSVDLVQENESSRKRLTVGMGDHYLVKIPSKDFPEMVELEDLTMHMASVAGIETAKHTLVRLKSGELAFLVKRFDRGKKKQKFSQEDFCQLSDLPTAEKYSSSYEKAGKIIKRWSSNTGIDTLRFFEVTLFSFITGNSDMHLKNFSLVNIELDTVQLSPAYDLLPTQLLTEDDEEAALTLNAKKSKLTRNDFERLAENLGIPAKVVKGVFEKLKARESDFGIWIGKSFLSDEMKKRFKNLLKERLKRLVDLQ